jgi:methionyl-tRNA formyltransferase
MSALRVVFMGTAELACPSLEALARSTDFHVVGVVTQPDRPKGRDLKLQPPPVKVVANRFNLPVFQPERLRHEPSVHSVASLQPELIVVAAFGQILPPSVLELPRWGCLNVHASLLPKYRGAAPIQWALLNGETETGITIMKIDEGLDTGAILSQQSIAINPDDNAQTLHDRLAQLGAELLLSTIRGYVAGNLAPRPQPVEGVSYARKITKEDGRLDWTLSAQALWRRVRALNPWPGAYTFLPRQPQSPPQMLKIWQAAVAEDSAGLPGEILHADAAGIVVGCGQHALRILALQREGKCRMDVRAFLAGSQLRAGQGLG